jgi:hypothetical protein
MCKVLKWVREVFIEVKKCFLPTGTMRTGCFFPRSDGSTRKGKPVLEVHG